tara:strand:+ start:568 stop:1101 length:534 start_codon:yes stop_codon:yes gene_type:complete
MIPEVIHIIGCGMIGSNLSLDLAKTGKVKDIHIYDWDKVSEGEVYPFSAFEDLHKTDVVKIMSSINLFDVVIHPHTSRVLSEISKHELVVDCRDNKKQTINADFSASLDGSVLVIDSTEKDSSHLYPHYTCDKNFVYINIAVSLISLYIDEQRYTEKKSLIFNLDDLFDNCKQEDEG